MEQRPPSRPTTVNERVPDPDNVASSYQDAHFILAGAKSEAECRLEAIRQPSFQPWLPPDNLLKFWRFVCCLRNGLYIYVHALVKPKLCSILMYFVRRRFDTIDTSLVPNMRQEHTRRAGGHTRIHTQRCTMLAVEFRRTMDCPRSIRQSRCWYIVLFAKDMR